MNRFQLFAAIICAVVLAGSVSPISGQALSPAAQAQTVAPVVPLKVPATYVSAQTPADQLQLNADNSFSLQEAGQTYHGTFFVSGNTMELRISETNTNTTATMQGSNLTDSSGQTWVLREPPMHPALVPDVVKNQDVIRLVKAGLDDEIVIAKIRSSKCQFDMSPGALIQLRQNGVSAAVIKSMAGSGIPPAAGGGAASTLPPVAPGHQSQAGSVDASLNPPAQASPKPPAPTATIQPGPRQDHPNKTAADLRPVERIYTDIKLDKTTQPQRFGDVALRLTKVNPKTGTYSVEILADHKMTLVEDKSINEIVEFNTARGGRNLVINQVTNDAIAGYLWREPLMATGCRSLQVLKLKDVRNCFDVKLGKTLHPQRFADITLKLESTDPKHNKYTVIVVADDKSYEKKDKNANELVQFYTSQGGHNPYELVINQVNKDGIVGYLATPKDVSTVPPHNYFDVKLGRTLQPQRFADITLKLVNTDPEHNKYSFVVTADDKQYEKKDENANEAVQFYTSKGGHTPYELVINQITSDQIFGYLAVPKLTENGLPSQAGSADASLNPAAGTSFNPPEPAPLKQPSSGPTQVTGRVVWNGIPVPNAEVQLKQGGDYSSLAVLASTLSAADGTFTIQDPPAGSLVIYALAPDADYWSRVSRPVTVVTGRTKSVGDLRVLRKLHLLSPANSAIIATTTPTFQWADFAGASRYDITVFNSTTRQRVFFQSTQGTRITVAAALQSGQQYQWSVFAFNSSGQELAYWSAWYFSIEETKPVLPGTTDAAPAPNTGREGTAAPVVLYKREPDYPEKARKARLQGTVVVSVEVDTSGHATNLRVVRPLGLGLDEKAMEAVSKWLFKPGMRNGVPVPMMATIEVNFRLD